MRKLWTLSLILLLGFLTQAKGEITSSEVATMERARLVVGNKLHLLAYDLLDELIYELKTKPIFDHSESIAVMTITGPSGLNQNFVAVLENHLFALMIKNPQTHLTPVHCPYCQSLTAYANSESTTMVRGIDLIPSQYPQGQKLYGLYIDFTTEGSFLVLRSRITSMRPGHPIIYARTIAANSAKSSWLRNPDHLVSAEVAKSEYVSILREKNSFVYPLTFAMDIFPPGGNQSVVLPPMLWTYGNMESPLTQSQIWLGSLHLGVSSQQGSYDAWSLGTRFSRSITDQLNSLVAPQLYLFFDGSYFELVGGISKLFRNKKQMTPQQIINDYKKDKRAQKVTNASIKLGMELKMKHFFHLGFYAITFPNQLKNENFPKQNGFAHGFGFEFGVTL